MADIFDEIELKDVFDEVESDRIGDKIFNEVEKELPSLVRSYVKEQTKKIKTLTPSEIKDLVDSVISKIPQPKPERVIEKTIEKRIEVEKKDTKKYAELSQIEELKKQLEELRASLKNREPDVRIVGNMVPNYSSSSGKVLSNDGSQLQWVEGGGSNASSGTFVIGPDTTEGSWRFTITGTDLIVQRYESGSWVEKGSFLA